MKKKVIILGTGGNCIDILDALEEINRAGGETVYECAGFLDDDGEKRGRTFAGVKVLGALSDARRFADCFFVNGIGSPSNFWKKPAIIAGTGIPKERFLTIVHPAASVSRMAEIGRGSVIFQNVSVTSGAKIGDHVVILPNAVISHDCIVGDYTCVAGGASVSGNVKIGERCYIGANASIRNGLEIGAGSLVGMGSVVLETVAENTVVAGNPARFLRRVE
jgi:sugar O-acyltransferase (sialic acid O-acetyltransferase NeuD family)